MLRNLALVLAICVPVAAALAESSVPAPAAAKATEPAAIKAPDVLVREAGEELIGRIKENQESYKADPAKLYAMVDEVVLPHFDFRTMAKLVLARNWVKANDEQRDRFQAAFRDLLVKTYGDALLSYSDETIAWEPFKAPPDAERVKVASRIESSGAQPIPMQYSLHRTDSGWKVYDVSVDNISLVTNYRGTYASEIRKNGLDALIATLEGKSG